MVRLWGPWGLWVVDVCKEVVEIRRGCSVLVALGAGPYQGDIVEWAVLGRGGRGQIEVEAEGVCGGEAAAVGWCSGVWYGGSRGFGGGVGGGEFCEFTQ